MPFTIQGDQPDPTLPVIVGGLVVLLLGAVALFWFLGHKSQAAPPAPAESPGGPPTQIDVPPPLPSVVSLEFITESGQTLSFTLDKPVLTIGRAPDNDIVLAAPILKADSASLHHARLRRDQAEFVVRDLGSRNGLAVNGRQTIENLLLDGDRLQFGEVEAVFHQDAGGAA